MKLNDRNYLRTLPTLALMDAAKYSDNELALVLAERLADAQADIAKLWRQYDDNVAYWQRKAADATLYAAQQDAIQAAHDDAGA